MNLKEKIPEYLERTEAFSAQEILKFVNEEFNGRVSFATSLGEEDQVLTDMIAQNAPEIEVFTLDTGRLFQESYDLMQKIQKRYKINFKIYYPDTSRVEEMVQSKGINLFYDSLENRKLCCSIRKIEPLKRALSSVDAWITGLRSSQGVTRKDLKTFEWDEGNQKIKVNPLAQWSLDDVRNYIKEHKVDVNPLHAKGFVSIGCAPCTRAIKEGEDIRAGRWWWEAPEQKECGLHNNPKWKGNK